MLHLMDVTMILMALVTISSWKFLMKWVIHLSLHFKEDWEWCPSGESQPTKHWHLVSLD